MDRSDTANGIGGGLAVYTVNGLTILPCDRTCDFNQYCKFKVISGSDVVYMYLIYRPPSSRPETIGQLSELFRDAEKNSVFFGDFNLPDINWSTGVAASRMSRGVVEAAAEAGLRQLVDFPTHTRGNTLDLIITNSPERITNIREEARIGRSDHMTIMSELKMTSSSKARIRVKNWSKANWDGIIKV
jgi:hypothetical protein